MKNISLNVGYRRPALPIESSYHLENPVMFSHFTVHVRQSVLRYDIGLNTRRGGGGGGVLGVKPNPKCVISTCYDITTHETIKETIDYPPTLSQQ